MSPITASGRVPEGREKRVVIAGGGFAALEAALGLRALANGNVQIILVSPNRTFAYRPEAPTEALRPAAPVRYDLAEIAADIGAEYHRTRLEAVAPEHRWALTESGRTLGYDFLIVAIGARLGNALPGAFTFRDQRDVPAFRMLLDELASGAVRRLAFAVPAPNSWPLPVYELALVAAGHAERHSVDAEISVVTPEKAPLAVFGSKAVRDLLQDRGVRFIGSSIPHFVRADGSLVLQYGAPIKSDRVVAAPALHGPRITGVPADRSGFVPTDDVGRVEGLASVYAAGDVTTYPIKQGGIAAQQADLVAQTIAAELGAPMKERHQPLILRARLLHGQGALVLRAELNALARPTGATLEHRESRHASDLKVFGLYLTPYLSIYRSRLEARTA